MKFLFIKKVLKGKEIKGYEDILDLLYDVNENIFKGEFKSEL